MGANLILPAGSAAADSTPAEDPVTRSLRFDGSSYLSRVTGSTSTTWTISMWFKRGKLAHSVNQYLAAWNTGEGVGFRGTGDTGNVDKLSLYDGSGHNRSAGVYRDPSAWAHICVSVNSGTGTVYYNGESIISGVSGIGAWGTLRIGDWASGTTNAEYFGIIADVYGIEGSALDHTSFSESNDYGGLKPKAYTGAFGTNGFHIDAQSAHDADFLVSSIDRNDGDTLFADFAGHALTKGGDPEHSIAVGNPFTGDDRAIYFDGTGDNLVVTSDSSFNEFGTGDFTIEMWVNPTDQGSGSFAQMFELWDSSSDRMYLRIERQSSQNVYKFVVSGSDSFDVESDSAPDYGNWQHLAVVRNGTSITMYVDGTAQTDSVTISSSATYNWASTDLNIGKGSVGGSSADYEGYIFDYRITKGTALYTSNFTPPTSKLSDDSSSLLLQPTKTDTSIGDSSSNSHTVTTAGSPTRTASTPYDAAAKSTAIHLDGSDYLVTGNNSDFTFGTGDLTVEFWVNPSQVAAEWRAIIADDHYAATNYGWIIYQNYDDLKIYRSGGTNILTKTDCFVTGEWMHIAWVRSSGTSTLYVNGVAEDTYSDSSNYNGDKIYIGQRANGSYDYEGYLYDVRLTKGTARYTSNFTAPSAPLELNPVYIGGDQSGNKNHFQPTNISSHDVVLDTPTQNYAVLNPLSKSSGGSLAEGNLKVPFGGTYPSNVLGSMGVSSGKWYWEVYLEGGSSANGHACGVAVPEWANKNSDPDVASTPYAHYVDSRSKFVNNGSATSNSTSISPQDIIGVALNADDDEISFYKNGSIIGSAQSLDANQTWMPFHKNSSYTALTQWVNFGQDPTFAGNKTSGQDSSQGEFYYAPPNDSSGNPFKSLNTSNLGTPVIKPAENFNTVLYEGNSTTGKEIDTVGFEPNLIWTKARHTNGTSHKVYDSLRGNTKKLETDNDTEEGTVTDLNSFGIVSNDLGFTLDSGSGSNYTGRDYVAWNWKAHQTPTSTRTTYTVKVEDSGGDAWDSSGSFVDGNNLPSVYMEIWENRNGSLVSLDKVAVRYYDSAGNTNSDLSEQTYELKCVDLNAITVKWHYDTSGDGDESDYPSSYNDYLNEQKITILDGSTSEWTTNNHSNDDGGTDFNYSPPTGWANGDTLKSATTSYNGSDTATLTSGSGPVEKYNAAAGLSIITYSGNGSSDGDTQEITHTLGAEPEFIIAKSRSSSSSNGTWNVYHKHAEPSTSYGYGTHGYLRLDENYAASEPYYDILIPKSGSENTIINTVHNSSDGLYTNESGVDYVMYAWAPVEGYSKFGKYTGNASADGPFIYTGFRPAFVLWKGTGTTNFWNIMDNKREGFNPQNDLLFPNDSRDESNVTDQELLSNGFKLRTSGAGRNANNETFIYAAFAESPFKYANAR